MHFNFDYRYRTQATLLAPLEDEGAKQRMRVNNKLGYKLSFSTSPMSGGGLAGPAAASARMMMGGGGEEKVEIRESFVAPEISMINFFLSDVSEKYLKIAIKTIFLKM